MRSRKLPKPGKIFQPLSGAVSSANRGTQIAGARTRFAPSPTGTLHLGSLRTAIFNFLLAKSTNGKFLLRLEDTDQKRLVPGAEEDLYKTLRWCGLQWDEGPEIGGPYGPYRQSDRKSIYQKYANVLLESGHAYHCHCPKERLDSLTESARKLWPPSTASYDRRCYHDTDKWEDAGSSIVRFRSPDTYPKFTDLLHGEINVQIQTNPTDIRYDDFTLIKSDGMPTYHFANVVDDHLMKISHVVRGEEWLPSTPKHVALYNAFGWEPPEFIHIPLLTGQGGKKLSKRRSDTGIHELSETRGILPESLVNYVSFLGWSAHLAPGQSEVMSISELIEKFNVNGLTKGNVQIDLSKLDHLDQAHYRQLVEDQPERIFDRFWEHLTLRPSLKNLPKTRAREIFQEMKSHAAGIKDLADRIEVVYNVPHLKTPPKKDWRPVLESAAESLDLDAITTKYPKKIVYPALRYALLDSVSGVSIPEAILILDNDTCKSRVKAALEKVEANAELNQNNCQK